MMYTLGRHSVVYGFISLVMIVGLVLSLLMCVCEHLVRRPAQSRDADRESLDTPQLPSDLPPPYEAECPIQGGCPQSHAPDDDPPPYSAVVSGFAK